MHEMLIKALRDEANEAPAISSVGYSLMRKAADVIEELEAFKAQITDGHFYCMRDGVLYEATVKPPAGKTVMIPPVKGEEGNG